MAFGSGSQIGQYTIIEKIGKGGMATVYKAHHAALDRHVAIKVMHSFIADDELFIRRFEREARVVARLDHSNIIPVYDFAEHDGEPFLVMRYVEGDTLKERMARGQLPPPEITRIFSGVAAGLDYAHGQGVLHRDVKPSNIILTDSGGIYITDFGLARMAQSGESTISQGMLMGTPQYMSPEQARGDDYIDARADLYSLGVVLYEMITGRVPFNADTSYTIIHDHIFTAPPRPRELDPAVPESIELLLLRALAKGPADRFGSAGDVAAALSRAWSGEIPPASPPSVVVEASQPNPAPVSQTTIPAPDQTAVGAAATMVSDAPTPYSSTPTPPPTPATVVTRGPTGRQTILWVGIGLVAGVALVTVIIFGLISLNRNRQAANAANATATAVAAVATSEAAVINDRATAVAADATAAAAQPDQIPDDGPPFDMRDIAASVRPLPEIQAAVRDNPEDARLRAELFLALVDAGELPLAREVADDFSARSRTSLPLIILSTQLFEVQRPLAAVLILERAWRRFPTDRSVQHNLLLGYVMLDAGGPNVLEFISDLERRSPGADVFRRAGITYRLWLEGEPEAAIGELNAIVAEAEADGVPGELLYVLGLFYARSGQPEAALETLHDSLTLEHADWLTPYIESEIAALEAD